MNLSSLLLSFLLAGLTPGYYGQTYEDCAAASSPVLCGFNKKTGTDKIAVCQQKTSKKGGVSEKTYCVDPNKKMKHSITNCGCCAEESSGKASPDYCPTPAPSAAPVVGGTAAPVVGGTPAPIAGTLAPVAGTAAPVAAPVTAAPVVSCVDDSTFQYKRDRNKDCDWVAEKPAARCIKKWKGIRLSEYCPAACNAC